MLIEKAKTKHLNTLVDLHMKNLVSPSSKIGKVFLEKLYKIIFSDQNLHLCFVATKDEKIIGAIIITKNLDKTNKLLKRFYSPSTYLLVVKSILKREVTPSELVNRYLFERKILIHLPKSSSHVLVIFVDKKFQGIGVGKKLIQSGINELIKQKIENVYVDYLITNKQAIKFYEGIGFKKIDSYYKSNLYIKNLK